jgi:hypothetical protein
MADEAPWPLWGPHGLLDEHDLPLSEPTRTRIKAWFNAYDDVRPDWPLWLPPPGTEGTEAEEDAWAAEGEAIRDLVQRELGPEYEVVFGP